MIKTVAGGVSNGGPGSFSTLDVSGQATFSGPAIIEKRVTANTSTAYTINPVNGHYFDLTLNGNCTITAAATLTSAQEEEVFVKIIGGAFTLAWSGVTWDSGTAPSSPGAGSNLCVTLVCTSSEIRGFAALQPTDSLTLGALTVNGTTNLNGGLVLKTRSVIAAGAVTVTSADCYVGINKTVGAATTVNLPSSPSIGQTVIIKDEKADAATNNITVTPAAGNIDGLPTYVINTDKGSITTLYNGTQWSIF